MNKQEIRGIRNSLSEKLGANHEFKRGENDFYVKNVGSFTQYFWLDADVRMGVGELTLNIGIDFEALKATISPVVDEKQLNWPCLASPVFRFADLSQVPIHDFIVKIDRENGTGGALDRLEKLWGKFAVTFYSKFELLDSWDDLVKNFLSTNRLGPIRVPIAAPLSVAWQYAMRGSIEAKLTLDFLKTAGSKGSPIQSYEQAAELLNALDASPNAISKLKLQLESMN